MQTTLKEEEWMYLKQWASLPAAVGEALIRAKHNQRGYMLELPDVVADQLRDMCGEQLQRVGFDQAYQPTHEGELLESLIDKFYVQNS